jgi:hypothetical protein
MGNVGMETCHEIKEKKWDASFSDIPSALRWSQWPRGLRLRSSAARLLRLWVRIRRIRVSLFLLQPFGECFHAHIDERAGKARVSVTLPMDRGPYTARITRFLPHIRHSYVLCSLFTEGLHLCVQSWAWTSGGNTEDSKSTYSSILQQGTLNVQSSKKPASGNAFDNKHCILCCI